MESLEKKQTARVGVAGSFINQMMGNNSSIPEVGRGATVMHYTDRSCYEVIEVSEDGKTAKLQRLEAKWDRSKQGGEGHQSWILEPTNAFTTVVWRNNAWRVRVTTIEFTKEFVKEVSDSGYFSAARYLKHEKPELVEKIWEGDVWPQNVIEGITREKTSYSKIAIIFGVKDYHYDWSF